MIKLESAHIEEVRGIRKLDIDFKRKKFAVSGPNGSGKSGVIDAIEFGLTGDIGRLAGKGTKQLSIKEHGPHVDKVKFPNAAFVQLSVFFPGLNKSATITRSISAPQKPTIEPADADVLAAFKEVEEHPEITLSRREVLKFIITEPTTRSQDIQIILKLDGIGQTRSALNTAQNTLKKKQGQAESAKHERREVLVRHLNVKNFDAREVLEAVNLRREALDLPKISTLEADTKLDAGVAGGKAPEFNKQSALRDLKALDDVVAGLAAVGKKQASVILDGLGRLEADPGLLTMLHRRTLIEKGLSLVDGAECPLCDHEWDDEGQLRDHLRIKLAKSQEAGKLNDALLNAGGELSGETSRIAGLINPVTKIAAAEGEAETAAILSGWTKDLDQLRGSLETLDGITGLKDRLGKGWADMPPDLPKALQNLRAKLNAKPDQSARIDAQTFLTTAQARIADYRDASRVLVRSARAADAAKSAYDAYCRAMEDELNTLYQDVQEDFSSFYKIINEGDEEQFAAQLTPTEGRLDLLVNFYEKGLFPPAAFHSEGHQDGMGVCLYFALMKRLLGNRFTFALLDDVVMSVDVGHRYQFCKLLKEQFPDTQFVITTHDRLWAEQMRSAGVVSSKTSLVFQNWTVDTGPIVESDEEIWVDIDAALSKGKVPVAAAMVRHHLEYAVPHLAENLGARAVFRSDGAYELGDLLPSVLARMGELFGKAADAANSWSDAEARQAASDRKSKLSASNGASNVEQWAVNKAVHYNAWANFGKKDFQPVVAAFKDLMAQFRCEKCQSWLYITPKGSSPETLRCSCSAISMNLKGKPK
ncbi:chromosome segregation protein SMC [Hyphomicrobium nitrativorans NL23]|uniref:Chromosome segregation protein SMC n=1 Tax=Hyphomicrobium nitrativorans NL23 TaxID=1029756 RepID=V5SCE4_9HYPH|nr:ATP-binding protein [Hyphomicrobium nitrativorans]AHB47695.1 chromosome segregation protein SMC [Hyphomicrobium nitrativorans NL23]